MHLHEQSHIDHVKDQNETNLNPILAYVLGRFHDRKTFFLETIELPRELGRVKCALYGPAMGDPRVTEDQVTYGVRPGRAIPSRLVDRPTRLTYKLTVVAGPHDGHHCVLYTVYGGPIAPRELGDVWPDASEKDRQEAFKFWAEHALASGE